MSLRLNAAAKTDVGKQREQNEDNLYAQVNPERHTSGLFIVSDGMGGYHAGEVASQLAVETISERLQSLIGPTVGQPTVRLTPRRKRGKGERDDPAKTRPLNANGEAGAEATDAKDTDGATPAASAQSSLPARDPGETQQLSETMIFEHYEERLRAAIEDSSKVVVEYGLKHHEARGLGATVTAALVVEGMAFIANVGDSRTYLMRNGKLERVTRDHSLVERLVEAGQIDREDVYDHPSRNLIYRSLGAGHAEVDVDIFNVQLQPGDSLLLCTDGLWEMVHDPQLASILGEDPDPDAVCAMLIDKANENGGEDNITALLVRCLEA